MLEAQHTGATGSLTDPQTLYFAGHYSLEDVLEMSAVILFTPYWVTWRLAKINWCTKSASPVSRPPAARAKAPASILFRFFSV